MVWKISVRVVYTLSVPCNLNLLSQIRNQLSLPDTVLTSVKMRKTLCISLPHEGVLTANFGYPSIFQYPREEPSLSGSTGCSPD